MSGNHDPRGSMWHRWDLHFHTPASFDYKNKSVTDEQIVEELISHDIRVVAITDHHTMDVDRIVGLQKLGERGIGGKRLTVLPGIELRADQGNPSIHYICLFSEHANVGEIWTTVQGKLDLTPAEIRKRGGDEGVYVPLSKASEVARKLGGIITIHSGQKSNSMESIRNDEPYKMQIKIDIHRQYVDILEVGRKLDEQNYKEKVFPSTGTVMPIIICSDNHNVKEYQAKSPLWLRADPTFNGLRMVLLEPEERVFIGEEPPDIQRLEQNRQRYVHGLSFKRDDATPAEQKWFSCSIPINPGLVAIIGDKGSGKSALADTLGLLGGCRRTESFSFLNEKRFQRPTDGIAQYFTATLEWADGAMVSAPLSERDSPEDTERIKYLPQDHIENICNEVDQERSEFEGELKEVIFSRLPEGQRLDQPDLDSLLRFRTSTKLERIDTLQKQLREVSRRRVALESKLDPSVKADLQQKLSLIKKQIEEHQANTPEPATNPASSHQDPDADKETLQAIEAASAALAKSIDEIRKNEDIIRRQERYLELLEQTFERVENFRRSADQLNAELQPTLQELRLPVRDIIKVEIQDTPLREMKAEAEAALRAARKSLSGSGEEKGLTTQKAEQESTLKELRTKLDEPNQRYQAYLKKKEEWESRLQALTGNEAEPDSLRGIETALKSLDLVPAQLAELQKKQADLARQIHGQKLEQLRILRELYAPVQEFIDSHPIAKNKLHLEFRAQMVEHGFAGRFFEIVIHGRSGSFHSTEDGQKLITDLLAGKSWEQESDVTRFLDEVDKALHFDLREGKEKDKPRLLSNQIRKDKDPEEVYNLLYGLDYLRPRYILRWEGKDLSLLSPGECGTLLLVFYLLIDKGDTPLIIDQPEGNLDNHTVAKVLVECIRDAKKRRQVFIVTHNPNLAVVCDAEQVIRASLNKAAGNEVTYESGALEDPKMNINVTDVLEGTRWAFSVRGEKYRISEDQE